MRTEASCGAVTPSVTEATSVALAGTGETQILGDVGTFSACDVWMRVTPDWLSRVTLRVYARVGLARVLMRAVPLSTVTVTDDGDHRAGIAVSLRGHPCRAYEVTVQASEGDALEDGAFYLQAWHAGGAVAASAGDGSAPRAEVDTVLQGRTTMGASVDLHADDDGRLLISNPLLADDYITLPEVTSPPDEPVHRAQFFYTDDVLHTVASRGKLLTEFLSSEVALRTEGVPIAVQPREAASGVGVGALIAGGMGAPGSAGGTTTIGADNGGTPGTNLAGDVIVQLGTGLTSTGETAKFILKRGASEILRGYYASAGASFLRAPGWMTIAGDGGLMVYAPYQPATFGSVFNHAMIQSGSAQPIYLFANSGGQVAIMGDFTYEARIGLTPSTTPTVLAGPTCTSFTVGQHKRAATGANAGAPLTVKAQDGQNVGSGTNNAGGELRLESGAMGTGGSGGTDGTVTIKTGSTDRVTVAGSGGYVALATTRAYARGQNGLEEDFFADFDASGLSYVTRHLHRRYVLADDGGPSDVVLYTDPPLGSSYGVLYRFTCVAQATSGTLSGRSIYVSRQALVEVSGSVPTVDASYNLQSEQRMFSDSVVFVTLTDDLLIDVNGSNEIVLKLTRKTTDTRWHWTVWCERIALRP